MKLGHLELFVRDPERSKDFYVEGLGFDLEAEQPGGFTWVRLLDREILLRPGRATDVPGDNYQEANSAMVLYTDRLDATLDELKNRGIESVGDDGPACATFRDPDGHWIQIAEN